MAQKNGKTEKKKPRAMPVEAIVTRFKSKQKLIQTEQQKTPKPKVNVKKQKIRKKSISIPKPLEQKLKTCDVIEKCDIYPDRLKRQIVNKKIVLVPKHSFKLIGGINGCNKRKLRIPQKVISCQQNHNSHSSNDQSNIQTEISLIDMVRIVEDSKSLDDEDLLEILTCPSPVWWEDPPDGYIEEAIFSRPQEMNEQKSVKNQILEEQNKEDNEKRERMEATEYLRKVTAENTLSSIEVNVQNRDKIFINKRSKLQTLLGNIIRSKENKEMTSDSANCKPSFAFPKPNSAISKYNSAESTIRLSKSLQKSQNSKRKTIKSKAIVQNTKLKAKKVKNKAKKEKKRNSDSFKLTDEEDILEYLENIDIPIEGDRHNLDLSIKNEKEDTVKEEERRISIDSNISDKNLIEEAEYLDMSVFDDYIDVREDQNTQQGKHNGECERSKTKEVEFNEISNFQDKNIEYVTVYKIINNEMSNEVNELKIILPTDKCGRSEKYKRKNGEINDYYKHSKKVTLDKKKVMDVTRRDDTLAKSNEKSIRICDSDTVRYCFVCSSIFDKESCDYCVKKNLRRKKILYFCDFCGLQVITKPEMIKHLEQHQ